MWIIYLASFTSSRSAENIACGLESLLRRVQHMRFWIVCKIFRFPTFAMRPFYSEDFVMTNEGVCS